MRIKNFQESLEKDLARLTAEIKEQRERMAVDDLPERDLVKQSIRSFAAAQTPARPPVTEDTVSNPALPSYLQVSDPKVKLEVEKLVDLVFRENLEKAVREAKKQSPFIEDAFHDALVDKLLPELKKRGVLK